MTHYDQNDESPTIEYIEISDDQGNVYTCGEEPKCPTTTVAPTTTPVETTSQESTTAEVNKFL